MQESVSINQRPSFTRAGRCYVHRRQDRRHYVYKIHRTLVPNINPIIRDENSSLRRMFRTVRMHSFRSNVGVRIGKEDVSWFEKIDVLAVVEVSDIDPKLLFVLFGK